MPLLAILLLLVFLDGGCQSSGVGEGGGGDGGRWRPCSGKGVAGTSG
jgi:hypothetical protein